MLNWGIAGGTHCHKCAQASDAIRASRKQEPRPAVEIPRRSHTVSKTCSDDRVHYSMLLAPRFIDSEADLDAAIKALLPLAQDPVLSYAELLNSGAVDRLIGLLSHENADIVIDVVEVIHELTDEEVGNEGEEDSAGASQDEREEALKNLIEGLVGLLSLRSPT